MRLNQFHYFRHRQNCFIYQVNDGNAYRIDPELGRLICQVKQQSHVPVNEIPFDAIAKFRQMNLLGTERGKARPAGFSTRVSALSLNVAQTCNMRCRYCYGMDGSYGKKGLMSEETAINAVDWLINTSGDRQNLALVFFGGEPLLNFNLIRQTVEYARRKGAEAGKEFQFSITTNGTQFSREIIDFLNKHTFSVTISFDGDRNLQNTNRPMANGSGSFRTVHRGMKKFLGSRGGNAIARATITSGFIDLQRIRQNLKMAGFKKIFYAPISTAPSDLFDLSEMEYHRICADLESQAEELVFSEQKKKPVAETAIPDMVNLLHSTAVKTRYCGAGRKLLAVSAEGKIYPCHRFVGLKDWELGDLEHFNESLCREFIGEGVDTRPVCRSCWARYLCGGGCMHHNLVRNGSVAEPDPRQCGHVKKCIEMAIYVAEKLNRENRSVTEQTV